jgi:hypothetical protein
MRAAPLAAAITSMLVLAPPVLAGDGKNDTTFNGTCLFEEGRILYPDEGLRDEPERLLVVVKGEGTCQGSVDGGESDEFAFEFKARGKDRFSCNPGDSIDRLPGVLNLAGNGRRIAGFLSITTTGIVVNPGLTFEGRESGELTGNASAMPPPDAAQQCMTKRGLRRVPFNAQVVGEVTG